MIIKSPDSLESSLFLRVAASYDDDAAWPAPAIGSAPWDWDRLIALALLDNAITVLDNRASRLPESLLPLPQRDRIARLGMIWTFKLKLLEQRLQESVAALSRAGIEVILLKGAALALTTYRSFTERPMADIDVLVDPVKAREAYDVMRQNGWLPDAAGHPADAWDNHHHLPPLRDLRGSDLRLEIHSAPLPPGHPFRLDYDYVRATSEQFEVAGFSIRVPEPHVHAVHTSIHFAWSHRFESGAINAFRDLAALAKSGRFSWDRFVAAARQARAERACYWTLRLARALSGLAVPDSVLAQLAPQASERLLSLLEKHFSQLVLRSERACPSVTLCHRLWAAALETAPAMKEEAAQWNPKNRANAPPRAAALRRVGSHLKRVRQWSLYAAGLVAAASSASAGNSLHALAAAAHRFRNVIVIQARQLFQTAIDGTEEVHGPA